MALAVLACFFAMGRAEDLAEAMGGSVVSMEYGQELFDTEQVMEVDIRMQEEDWEDMLANALAKEYYACDVVINGTEICDVGVRPKGNTSLSSIAMDETTDRYSLKLEFDHYVEGQTCFGLDKLILNNNYADATNMKEAIVYDMYRYLEADASYCNYAKVSVNGEYRGLYLALEAVEESFLLRNYGTQAGELYKPESMEMGGGPGKAGGFVDKERRPEGGSDRPGMPEGAAPLAEGGVSAEEGVPALGEPFAGGGLPGGEELPDGKEPSAWGGLPGGEEPFAGEEPPALGEPFAGGGLPGGEKPPDAGELPGGGFSSGGADLRYTDDSLDSYAKIWEGEVTDTGERDRRRVVEALKSIREGTDLERCLDVDNVLKYMAVHTFCVNLDSLSGNMAHNYYLYEQDGKLNILPWDYNLSFGGMAMGEKEGASGMINDAIDTPFPGTDFFDALLEDETYLERYHGYLQELTEGYVSGGNFERTYSRIRKQIDMLVKTDPTAFYSYEEYEAGADMLYQTVVLRAESIDGQLKGEIPSTDEGQRKDASDLIDASKIDLDCMGTFGGGNGIFR